MHRKVRIAYGENEVERVLAEEMLKVRTIQGNRPGDIVYDLMQVCAFKQDRYCHKTVSRCGHFDIQSVSFNSVHVRTF